MGSGKRRIPIARIADLQARRVCFAKRRKGLFRKCSELCELFPGYEVAAVAFSPDIGNPFAFAGPSPAASPADLFRRFLSGFDPLSGVSPHSANSEAVPHSVSTDGPAEDGLGAEGLAGRMMEDDGAHHCISSLSSSPSLDDELTQTLLNEEERAELAAALLWADGVLAFGDGSMGGGRGVRHRPAAVSTTINPLLLEEEDLVGGWYGPTGSVLVPDDAAALAVAASPLRPKPRS